MTVVAIPVPPQGVMSTPPMFSTTNARALQDLRSTMAAMGFRLSGARRVSRGIRTLRFVTSLTGQPFELTVQVLS